MVRFISILSILLVAVSMSCAYVIPDPISCTEEGMTSQLQELIGKLETIYEDAEALDDEVSDAIPKLPIHAAYLEDSCGEEGAKVSARIEKFYKNLFKIIQIVQSLDANEVTKAKEVIDSIDEEYIMRLFINNYAASTEKVSKIIELTKVMENQQFADVIKQSTIKNINVRKVQVPEDQIQYLNRQINTNE